MEWKQFLEENDTPICFDGHKSVTAHGYKIPKIVASLRYHIFRGRLDKAQMCLLELWMFQQVFTTGGQVVGNWLGDARKMVVEWCMTPQLISEIVQREDSWLEETLTLESLLCLLERLVDSPKSKRVYLYQEWVTSFPSFLNDYQDIFANPLSELFHAKWVSWSEKLSRKEQFEDGTLDLHRRIYQCTTTEEVCKIWKELEMSRVSRENMPIYQPLEEDYQRLKRRFSLEECRRYTSYMACCLEMEETCMEPSDSSEEVDAETAEETYRQSIEWEKRVDWVKNSPKIQLVKSSNPKGGWQHSPIPLCELVINMEMYRKNHPIHKEESKVASKSQKPKRRVKATKSTKGPKNKGNENPLWAAKDELEWDTTYSST